MFARRILTAGTASLRSSSRALVAVQTRGVASALPTLPQFSLQGKTAVVTGAAQGLGKEFLTALTLSGARGACVDMSLDRGQDSIDAISREVSEYYKAAGIPLDVPELRAYQCDVTSEAQILGTWAQLQRDFGKIDVVVTAAGIVENVRVEEYPLEKWQRMMNVNVNGTFLFAREGGKHMIEHQIPGSIIMISSMSAFIVNRPQPQSAYNASKAAVSHLMKSMAAEWAPHRIRVNALCPGYQYTALLESVIRRQGDEMPKKWVADTPLGRMGDPKELRGPIVFMASEASSFMTGHDLVVDGGYMVW